jgi:hypothetical protein
MRTTTPLLYHTAPHGFVLTPWRRGRETLGEQTNSKYLHCSLHSEDNPEAGFLEEIKVSQPCSPPHRRTKRLRPDIASDVPRGHIDEISGLIKKDRDALDHGSVKAIRKITVDNSWHAPGHWQREQIQVVYNTGPTMERTVRTISRPLTLKIDSAVSAEEMSSVEKRVRKDHAKIGEAYKSHLEMSNYGIVRTGWQHRESTGNAKEVKVDYYHVSPEQVVVSLGQDSVPFKGGVRSLKFT